MKLHLLAAVSAIISTTSAEPLSQAEVLKMSVDDLAQALGDGSEAGQDRAARLVATAKRLETEGRLAKEDVTRVLRLDDWRTALGGWQDLQLEVRAREAGGGTMWGHLAARDDLALEDFLATHAAALSAPTPEQVKPVEIDFLGPAKQRLDAAEKLIEELGMPGFDREELEQKLSNAQGTLSWLLGTVGDDKSRDATVQWLAALSAGEPAGGSGFSESLKLQGITFEVSWDSEGGELVIEPRGLELPDQTWKEKVTGSATGAEVADLDGNGFPEVYVYLRDDDHQATLRAFAVNGGKSMTPVHLQQPATDAKEMDGFGGSDEFAVVESTLVQRFPVMKDGQKTGKTRQLQYKLKAGEASWQLVLDRVAEY